MPFLTLCHLHLVLYLLGHLNLCSVVSSSTLLRVRIYAVFLRHISPLMCGFKRFGPEFEIPRTKKKNAEEKQKKKKEKRIKSRVVGGLLTKQHLAISWSEAKLYYIVNGASTLKHLYCRALRFVLHLVEC